MSGINQKGAERAQRRRTDVADLPAEGFCSIKELARPGGCSPWSRSSIFSLVKQGRFPQPVRIGSRCTRWRVADVRAYLADPAAWELNHAPDSREEAA